MFVYWCYSGVVCWWCLCVWFHSSIVLVVAVSVRLGWVMDILLMAQRPGWWLSFSSFPLLRPSFCTPEWVWLLMASHILMLLWVRTPEFTRQHIEDKVREWSAEVLGLLRANLMLLILSWLIVFPAGGVVFWTQLDIAEFLQPLEDVITVPYFQLFWGSHCLMIPFMI